MERWLTLYLSVFIASLGVGQVCNCSDKKVRDSLVTRYLEERAHKLPRFYNDPNWQAYCDSALAVCNNIAYVYQQKGLPCIKNGQYAQAFGAIDQAVELDPKRYLPYRGFLKCTFTKDYTGAISDFEKAQGLDPNNFEMDHTYFFWIGVCDLELKNYEAAKRNLLHDIQIQTQGDSSRLAHFNTLLYLGIRAYELQDYKSALDYFSNCLKQYQRHTNAHYYLALTYLALQNTSQAKKHLMEAESAIKVGHTIGEDNIVYVNYPHQVGLYEVQQLLSKIEESPSAK